MIRFINRLLDASSEFFSQRKGLLPALGILLVIANGLMQFFSAGGILAESNLFLHLGVIIAIFGIMLAWAL